LAFGDRTILDCQIQGLLAAGVSEIAIVVGHNATRIVDHIGLGYADQLDTFHVVYNPEYERTNNIYSLWMASGWLRGSDFLCLNADVLCHPEILKAAAAHQGLVSMVIHPAWRDETMKVIIRRGRIVRMSKGISREDFSGTYLGITRVSRAITSAVFDEIGRMIAKGSANEFFNVAVQRLVDRGLAVRPTCIQGLPWAEIDDPADHEFALANVYPRLPWGGPPAYEPVAAVA
jgi:choline kinase